MPAMRGCFKKNILFFDLVIASWDSSRLTRTIIRWRPASVSLSVQLCQGCIFQLLKVLIETYHIKEIKFSFISKKIWNCPGSTPPLAVRNISDRRNWSAGFSKRVASGTQGIVMHVYTSDLFIANCCSTSIEQSRLKFSKCLKLLMLAWISWKCWITPIRHTKRFSKHSPLMSGS